MPYATGSVRLAELMASLSVATDIGLGAPPENALRAALLVVPLAEAAGVGEEEARQAFYLSLLKTVGCTGDEDFSARLLGADVGSWVSHLGGGDPAEFLGALARNVGRDAPLPRRAAKLLRALGGLPGLPVVSRGHCEVGRLLAVRLGLSAGVVRGMEQVFERWDGGGVYKLKGEAIDRPVRLAHIAGDAQAAMRQFGVDATVTMIRKRRGKGYDPKLTDVFCAQGPRLLAALAVPSLHDAVLAAEPGGAERLEGEALETAIRTMGEFADMKSRYTRGHSAGVAALVGRAAARAKLDDPTALARAGHLHDVGRVGIVLDVWDKPGPLTEVEWERVRMHTYFTERILARLDGLAPVPTLAALAHERLDGNGYHRRLPPVAVTAGARLLAAADAYHAMTEPRAHRPAFAPDRAAELLQRDAAEGRFDREMVDVVLAAAGQTVAPTRRQHVAGLTEREIEVLRLLARGLTNKEIATALDIAAKTAGHHVQHIFEKAKVTTRAAATLFALQNDLLAAER